jgi:hypothetical protein
MERHPFDPRPFRPLLWAGEELVRALACLLVAACVVVGAIAIGG